MKYLIFALSLFIIVACDTNSNTTNNNSTTGTTTNGSTSLIDKAVGTYKGTIRLQSSSVLEGDEATVKVAKKSDTTIEVSPISGNGSSFELTLDEGKSNASALIFRDAKGQRIASLMHVTFSYSLPLAGNDVENFNGVKN